MKKKRHDRAELPPIKTAALFLCLLLLFGAFSLPVFAVPDAPGVPDHSHAQAVIVYNADRDITVLESEADKLLFPASTVKIMTGLLASELLSERMDETVTLTEEMLDGATGNRMKLESGEAIRIRDLYYGAICGGYNDACLALAVLSAGSVDGFVAMMNEKAAALGMKDTVYRNPTGLHEPTMVTTARDVLRLSLTAAEDPIYMEASSAVKHEIPATNLSGARSFYNRNYLIASAVTTAYHNPYASGLNGGMTSEGGWCLSTKVDRFDLTWFCVVLGGEEDAESGTIYSYKIANELLSWAARGYEIRTVAEKNEILLRVPVRFAAIEDESEEGIPLAAKDTISVFIPKNAKEGSPGLEYTVRLHASELEAPFPAGYEAGVVVFTFDGEEVGRVPLVTVDAVGRNEFTFLLSEMKALPKNRVFMAALIAFTALIAVYVLSVTRFTRPRRRRSSAYVPAPFHRGDRDGQEEKNEERMLHRPSPPPRDPYASTAAELERRRRKK